MPAHGFSPILDIKRSERALEVFGNMFTAKYTNLLDTLEPHNIDCTAFFRLLSRYNGTKTKLLALSRDKTPLPKSLDNYDRRMAKEKVNIEMQNTY